MPAFLDPLSPEGYGSLRDQRLAYLEAMRQPPAALPPTLVERMAASDPARLAAAAELRAQLQPSLKERIFAAQPEPGLGRPMAPPPPQPEPGALRSRVWAGQNVGGYGSRITNDLRSSFPGLGQTPTPQPDMSALRAGMTAPRAPTFDLSVPKSLGEFVSPGTRAAAGAAGNAVATGARAVGAALPGVARGLGLAAGPAFDAYREREQLFGPDADLASRVGAVGRSIVREVPAFVGGLAGGLGGSAVAGPIGGVGGAVAGGAGGYALGDKLLNALGANTPQTYEERRNELLTPGALAALEGRSTASEAAPAPQSGAAPSLDGWNQFAGEYNNRLGFDSGLNKGPPIPYLPERAPAGPTGMPAPQPAPAAAVRPSREGTLPGRAAVAAAPSAPPALTGPQAPDYNAGDLFSPEAKAQIDKIAGRSEELSNLSKQYFEAQGQREPRGLSSADKLQILAKGLGTAALIAAFPGAGLLMAIGGGLLGGSSEANDRRSANAAADQQDFTNANTVFGNQKDILTEQMKNERELLGLTTGAEKERFTRNRQKYQDTREQQVTDRAFNEDVRRFGINQALKNRELALRGQQVSSAGLVPIYKPDGSVQYVRPSEGATYQGQPALPGRAGYGGRGALGGSRAPTFNPLPERRELINMYLQDKRFAGNLGAAEAAADAKLKEVLSSYGYATGSPAAPSFDNLSDEEFAARY